MNPSNVQWCLVVADAARARLFSIDFPDGRVETEGPELRELSDLVHPENTLPGREVFSNVHSGRSHASPAGPSHGLDDHRERHEEEERRRFAARVAAGLVKQLAEREYGRVILVAPAATLGRLREHLADEPRAQGRLTELELELTRLTPTEIRSALEKHDVLRPRQASGGYRPRGQEPI